MKSNLSDAGGRMPARVDRYLDLLGADVFFVPCKPGEKVPLLPYTDRTWESTQAGDYRALLDEPGNGIAVYLGAASGGLCAIDFDQDADFDAFLALNPALAATTRSRGSRGCMLWIRVAGEYPASCNPDHKHFEWRADRRLSMIAGRHPKGMEYELLVDAPPVQMAFAEIVWPAGWQLPWADAGDAELRQKFGQPFYINAKKAFKGINESYWAALFARENEIFFDPNELEFYEYQPATGLYEAQSEDSLRTRISERLLAASREIGEPGLEEKRTSQVLKAVVLQLRGQVELKNAFQNRPVAIHLANGMMVFENDEAELRPFGPQYYSRNASPIAFDEHARCDRFLKELVLPAVAEEDAKLLQKCAGMFLLGNNRAQRILILTGTGGTGKSQLAIVLQMLVGRENVTELRTKQLAGRFETHRFLKKTLLAGVDVDADFLNTEGAATLKGLVGGDLLDAEGKNKNGAFPLVGRFNVIITANSDLRVLLQGDVTAWKRRLVIVRYEKTPPVKKIPNFGEFLITEEGSGILNWALQGVQMLLAELPAAGGDFLLTEPQKQRVDAVLAQSESVRHFLSDRVVLDDTADLSTAELTEAYGEYCRDRQWRALRVSEVQSQLEDLMLELFQQTKRHDVPRDGGSVRGYRQVALRGSA